MEKVKVANVAVGPALQTFAMRCQNSALNGGIQEVYVIEEVQAELGTAIEKENAAKEILKGLIKQITGEVYQRSNKIKSRMVDVEAAISSCDERRKALLRASMDEADKGKKAGIEKEIANLRTESADNQYKLGLLKEKLKLAKEITPDQKEKIETAQSAAEEAERKVHDLKCSLMESLDNSIIERLGRCQEIQNSLWMEARTRKKAYAALNLDELEGDEEYEQ